MAKQDRDRYRLWCLTTAVLICVSGLNGSIQAARRAEEQLPVELQKQQELIDQMKALETE